jgi:polyisoprenoid-binding protein YceI
MAMRLLCLLLLLAAAPAAAETWTIDPETRVVADVHWRDRRVEVRFPTLRGTIEFDERRPEQARATIVVAADDATTGAPMVDALMQGPGFLAVDRHPEITFRLDRLRRISARSASVEGWITLRGITRPTSFAATVIAYGPLPGDPARFRAGFDLAGAIDRTAFGSTEGLPEIAAELPVRIRLLMTSR